MSSPTATKNWITKTCNARMNFSYHRVQSYTATCKYIIFYVNLSNSNSVIYNPLPLSGSCSVFSTLWSEIFPRVYSWTDFINMFKTCNILKGFDGKAKICRYFLTYSYIWKENQLLTLHVHMQSQRCFSLLSLMNFHWLNGRKSASQRLVTESP